jgi:hypothetical protein
MNWDILRKSTTTTTTHPELPTLNETINDENDNLFVQVAREMNYTIHEKSNPSSNTDKISSTNSHDDNENSSKKHISDSEPDVSLFTDAQDLPVIIFGEPPPNFNDEDIGFASAKSLLSREKTKQSLSPKSTENFTIEQTLSKNDNQKTFDSFLEIRDTSTNTNITNENNELPVISFGPIPPDFDENNLGFSLAKNLIKNLSNQSTKLNNKNLHNNDITCSNDESIQQNALSTTDENLNQKKNINENSNTNHNNDNKSECEKANLLGPTDVVDEFSGFTTGTGKPITIQAQHLRQVKSLFDTDEVPVNIKLYLNVC